MGWILSGTSQHTQEDIAPEPIWPAQTLPRKIDASERLTKQGEMIPIGTVDDMPRGQRDEVQLGRFELDGEAILHQTRRSTTVARDLGVVCFTHHHFR